MSRKNLILYVIDSLRGDSLRRQELGKTQTPVLNKLADTGTSFERCYTQATWTRPAAASLLTSLYPSVHQTVTRDSVLPFSVETLPHVLQKEGYTTAACSAMCNFSSHFGFSNGFEIFCDLFLQEALKSNRWITSSVHHRMPSVGFEKMVWPLASDVTDWAIEFLHAHRRRPFFLLLWVVDLHSPYFTRTSDSWEVQAKCFQSAVRDSKRTGRSEKLREMYANCLEFVDGEIGRLLCRLEEIGILRNTIFSVVGDHGEGFFEHGFLEHANLPFEELTRVPWIINGPAIPPKRVSSLVEVVDVMPTLLNTVGVRPSTKGQGVVRSSERFIMDHLAFSETQLHRQGPKFLSVQDSQGMKYIEILPPMLQDRRTKYGSGLGMMFDLCADPRELSRLRLGYDEDRDRLRKKLAEWESACLYHKEKLQIVPQTTDCDDTMRRRLEALGYL